VSLDFSGVQDNNDWWHLNLGQFDAGTVIHYFVGAIDGNGAVLVDNNNGVNYEIVVESDGFLTDYSSMGIPANFSGWSPSANQMTLVADYTWETEITFNVNNSNVKFKFAADNSWATNWGDADQIDTSMPILGQTADIGAADISVAGSMFGTFKFMFNEQTKWYSVEQL